MGYRDVQAPRLRSARDPLSLPLTARTATEAIGAAILNLGRHPTAVRWAELRRDRKPLVPFVTAAHPPVGPFGTRSERSLTERVQ
jgi:hypothetical protein